MQVRNHALILVALITLVALQTATVSAQVKSEQAQLNVDGAWVSMGPSPIENCGGGSANLCTGRLTAIAVDPSRPSTIYVGGAQGGVWKSTDGGSTWTPLTDNQPSLAIGSIAIDARGNIYAGTGEPNNCGDCYYGAGILRSTDGGSSWAQLGATTFSRSAFTKIIINPRNPNVVIASTRYGRTYSSSGGSTFVDPGVPLGVYVSTDGGNSWTRTLTVPERSSGWASDVVFDPNNPSTVYAAAYGGVFISSDGGTTWRGPVADGLPAPSRVGRINLGISPSSPLTVFAALEMFSGDSSQGALYKSVDGGQSWSQLQSPPSPLQGSTGFCGEQCDYDLFIAVDPTNPTTLYLGGLDLYRSRDGGFTWTDIGGYSGYIHPDHQTFAFDPTSHTTLYVGNDGGVWVSKNADSCSPSTCWNNLNSGLALTQFFSLSAHPTDRNVFFGGTQDNGTPMRRVASSVWRRLRGGDGGWAAFDRKNPLTMYHTFQRIDPERSDDGGQTWASIKTGIDTKDKSPFYIAMAMDSGTPTTLYLGTYRLYKTTNRGDNWFLPSPGLSFVSTGGCSAPRREDCISAITVAPSNGRYVYVGTNTGKFFTSSDGGEHFTENDSGLPQRRVTKISVDPTNPQRVFVTFSSFDTGRAFYSGNAGATWSDISSNLPAVPANSITLDATGRVIYVGTDDGVRVSTTNGLRWVILGRNLPRAAVYDLVFAADGTLLAATHGRGVWAFSARLVTIIVEPAGAAITVDGVLYAGDQLPRIFAWELGSTHTVQVIAITPGAPGVRYVFLQWGDGSKDTSRTIKVTEPVNYAAIFKTQYELRVIADYGDPQGGGWHDAGTEARFSVTPLQPVPGFLGLLGGKVIFQGWTGNSSAGTPAATIRMDAPKTVRALWATDNTQPYLILVVIAVTIGVAIALMLMKRRRRGGQPEAQGLAVTTPQPPTAVPGTSVGTSVSQRPQFCMSCGAPLIDSGATYCGKCGAKSD